jgi:hypothetical protein
MCPAETSIRLHLFLPPSAVLHIGIPDSMLRHMRTSVVISDALLEKARKVMAKRRVTLRSLVEEGLRRVLEGDGEAEFRPRDARFSGPLGFAEGRSERDVAAAIREFNDDAEAP